jgi:hypothetical protein
VSSTIPAPPDNRQPRSQNRTTVVAGSRVAYAVGCSQVTPANREKSLS